VEGGKSEVKARPKYRKGRGHAHNGHAHRLKQRRKERRMHPASNYGLDMGSLHRLQAILRSKRRRGSMQPEVFTWR
jgi:hypothetical protein